MQQCGLQVFAHVLKTQGATVQDHHIQRDTEYNLWSISYNKPDLYEVAISYKEGQITVVKIFRWIRLPFILLLTVMYVIQQVRWLTMLC